MGEDVTTDIPYKLHEITVSPEELLLDPNNPRLQHRAGGPTKYDPDDLADGQLQERIRRALHDKEHAVKRLVDSVKENGYVNIDSIFVKALPSVNKYLVIEGNRRTTAIKTILLNPEGVRPDKLKTLEKIPVKELICDDAKFYAQMTDFILSIRHIFGVKEWAPMQKAHSIYSSYMKRFEEESGLSKFRLITPIANTVGATMNLKPVEVRQAISIYRVYLEMQNAGYEVKSDHYTLIDLCLARPKMAEELFEYDKIACRMTDHGMALFNDLCIEAGCELSNPQKFRKFYQIWKDGALKDVLAVAERTISVDDALKIVNKSVADKDAAKKLELVMSTLEKIQLEKLRGTMKEKELVARIKRIIDTKIIPAIDE